MNKLTPSYQYFDKYPKPDRDRYATGYQWLDTATKPYWILREYQSRRRLDRILGITGSEHQRRAQRRELWVERIGRPMDGETA